MGKILLNLPEHRLLIPAYQRFRRLPGSLTLFAGAKLLHVMGFALQTTRLKQISKIYQ